MELLYTPKSELARLMRENSVTAEEIVFLFYANKLTTFDIRMNAPAICDRLLATLLKQSQDQTSGKIEAAASITV